MEIDLPTFISTLGISVATATWLAKSLVTQQLKKGLQTNKHRFDKELSEGLIRTPISIKHKKPKYFISYRVN